jgi:hypothetical protein
MNKDEIEKGLEERKEKIMADISTNCEGQRCVVKECKTNADKSKGSCTVKVYEKDKNTITWQSNISCTRDANGKTESHAYTSDGVHAVSPKWECDAKPKLECIA